jgi:hypothetical protein
MKPKEFGALLRSIDQIRAIHTGKRKPSRVSSVKRTNVARQLRKQRG